MAKPVAARVLVIYLLALERCLGVENAVFPPNTCSTNQTIPVYTTLWQLIFASFQLGLIQESVETADGSRSSQHRRRMHGEGIYGAAAEKYLVSWNRSNWYGLIVVVASRGNNSHRIVGGDARQCGAVASAVNMRTRLRATCIDLFRVMGMARSIWRVDCRAGLA